MKRRDVMPVKYSSQMTIYDVRQAGTVQNYKRLLAAGSESRVPLAKRVKKLCLALISYPLLLHN